MKDKLYIVHYSIEGVSVSSNILASSIGPAVKKKIMNYVKNVLGNNIRILPHPASI